MPITSTPELVAALRSLTFLTSHQMEEIEQRLAPRLPDPRKLADEVVRRGWLTGYQTRMILQGRGSDLVLGPYLLLDYLGAGGMGQVFKALHQQLGRPVALKFLRHEYLARPEAVQRFQREAKAVARLSHPNIVAIYDAGQLRGVHVLVMEFVEGIDLAKLVARDGPLPVTVACEYIYQAALALQHAHEQGLVHRDLKPPQSPAHCQRKPDQGARHGTGTPHPAG